MHSTYSIPNVMFKTNIKQQGNKNVVKIILVIERS